MEGIKILEADLTEALAQATTRINDLAQAHVPGADEEAKNEALKAWLTDPAKGGQTLTNPDHT